MAGSQGQGEGSVPGQGGAGGMQEPEQQSQTPQGSPSAADQTPPGPQGGPAPAPSDGQAGGQTSGEGSQGGQQQQEPPRVDWRDRRIGELTARGRELRAENERLKAQLAGEQAPNGQQAARAPNGQFQQPAGYQGPPDQATINQQIEERAHILAANQEFTRRCNEVAEVGRRTYNDFDSAVGRLVGLVDSNDPQGVQAYNGFLNAALETGEASKIIHALGNDLNEASRILSLNPTRMVVELTRMAARPVQALSHAPRPINPAASSGQNQRTSLSPDDPGSDQLSTEEWMKSRNEQVIARGIR